MKDIENDAQAEGQEEGEEEKQWFCRVLKYNLKFFYPNKYYEKTKYELL